MKTLLTVVALTALLAATSFGQFPRVSIRAIQEVPRDSLLLADSLQNTIPARWTLQRSPYVGQTVTVTALCVVPAKVIGFTQFGFTMLLYDTANIDRWRGLLVRATSDTSQHILDGFLNVERGDIIKMTGRVAEFPTTSMNSVTQFEPLPGIPIEIIGSMPIPAPPRFRASDFYEGVFPGGKVKYSTGEPYEGMIVEFTDLVVHTMLNIPNGTYNMVQAGNMLSTYDASNYYTLRRPNPPGWTYSLPPVGATIDTIRGMMTTVSGGENPRGYRIAPIYPGDEVRGISLPRVTSARRYPIVVSPDTSVRVTARSFKLEGGYDIGSVKMYYSVDNGPFTEVSMTLVDPVDSVYEATIPPQPANSLVKYFFKTFDTQNNAVTLASFAVGEGSDTSKGTFFYTVLNRPLTIRDVQYTPFLNGYSPYAENYPFGAVVSVSGVVTADTSNMFITSRSLVGGTYAWYMQSGNDPWSGIWIVGPESTMAALKLGDSITVTGTVQEWPSFGVNVTTRIGNIQHPVTIHASNRPVPAPVVKPTGDFGPVSANGDPDAEPYEGMLVKFQNVTVTDIYPYFADPSQYEINDGSGPVWVHRDGKNTFTNVEGDSIDASWKVLRVGNRISEITGLIHFSVHRYKFVPRGNSDFGTVVGVQPQRQDLVPATFALAQNYPNPFNPTTQIQYDVPSSAFVTLKVYNVLGQEVATIVNDSHIAGRYTIRFDASSLASGVYFYRLVAGDFISTKKMLLVK